MLLIDIQPAPGRRHALVRPATGIARAAVLTAMLAAAFVPPTASADGDGLRWARSSLDLRSHVVRLEVAGALERSRFARYALERLQAAYASELDTMLAERGRRLTNSEARWLEGTRTFANQLSDLAASISPASDVSIVAPEVGSMLLIVDGTSAIMSGPRLEAAAEFEARLLRGYCERYRCEWSHREQAARAVAATTAAAPPGCYEGQGQRSALAKRRRGVCERASTELLALASILGGQRRRGTVIDWRMLQIRPLGHGRPAYVALNDQGEFLLARLPLLERHPALVLDALPWLRRRTTGTMH